MRFILPLFLLASLQGVGCNEHVPPAAEVSVTEAAPAGVLMAPVAGVDDRLKGDQVIEAMGAVDGLVVADMFAGDGYYTWKLLAAGARVLAIDDDPEAIARLQAWKASQGIGDDRLLIRQTTPGIPGLYENEVDLALVTREFSTLVDRRSWIQHLMGGIRPPHTFYLVNYQPQQTPDGPPLAQRMHFDQVSDELTSYGVDDIGILYKALEDRYILFGSKPPIMLDPNEEGQ